MHSRPHHEAIERLKGREQMHKCWACGVSVLGLEQFRKHIETREHRSELLFLTERTQSGFTVDYKDEELDVLSAQRDQQRLLFKQQKKKEKQKRLREKREEKTLNQMKHKGWRTTAAGFVPPGSHAAKWNRLDQKSPACPLNNENEQRRMNAEADYESIRDGRAQYAGWNRYPRQPPGSMMWSVTDVDFTRDEDIFCSWKDTDESLDTSRKQDDIGPDQKRSRDTETPEYPPAKKQHFRDVTSPDCGVNAESGRVSDGASPAAPGHVDQVSEMLTNIRKSLDEKRLRVRFSEDPEFRSVRDDGLNPNDLVQETDVPHFQRNRLEKLIITRQTETFKTRRNSSPCRHSGSGAEPQENPDLTQTRRVLPTLLSRSVSKMEANKPNLKLARGIRASQKPSESRVLKPALQKLISSKSSEWRVNWKEIYQEATHRKLQREKGMPRFGIELVSALPPDPQDLTHLELDEGFQWASVECDAVTPPHSSEDACRFSPAGTRDPASSTTSLKAAEQIKREDADENCGTSGMTGATEFSTDGQEGGDDTSGTRALGGRQNLTPVVCVKTEKSDDYCTNPRQEKADQSGILCVSVQQNKQDFFNTDALNKNPPKNQVNELLVMSLREDELCSSLEDVESRLLQAQAALQTAFLEVQRLQLVKQQVTAEMSSLRSKRIDILRRIKRSGPDQASDAGSPGSPAVQTQRRAAGSSRQHRDTPLDRSTFLSDTRSDQRRPDFSVDIVPGSESRKTHNELSES